MDSSAADPQQQQPSQQQQQQQPQHHQPRPHHHQQQQHPHQHQHQPAQHQQSPSNPQAATAGTVVGSFPMTQPQYFYDRPFVYPPYAYPTHYAGQGWPQSANFQTPAQQLPNVGPPQPQTNVPHNKPTAQIVSNASTTDRAANQGLPNSTGINQSTNVPKTTRQRNPATLKDPRTNEIVSLELSKTSTSKPKIVDSPAQTLLQKVSEDGLDNSTDKQANEDKSDSPPEKQATEESLENPSEKQTTEDSQDNPSDKQTTKDSQDSPSDKQTTEDSHDSPADKPTTEDSNNDQEESGSKTELTYEPGQYNPILNKEGRRKYSKQFLEAVCERVCKITLGDKSNDDNLDGNRSPYAFSERLDLFQPNFCANQRLPPPNRQNDPNRRQNQHNYSGRSSAGQEKVRKVISSASLTQEVELKPVSNPWRPTKEVSKEPGTEDQETNDAEVTKKKFRSILNKLTPNNFDSLAASVTELNIVTESILGEVIDIVFAKALAEPGYCVLYGQMCSHLKKVTAGQANFGNTLLKRCQLQFQSDIYNGLNIEERKAKIENEKDPEVKKQLSEELYEDMYRCRMRGLGLIKFIGELYKIEMLNSQIMFDCVIRLLGDPGEESLECLCDLLTTIGEKLDKSCQKDVEKDKKASKNVSKVAAYQGGQKSAASGFANAVKCQPKPAEAPTLDQVFEQLAKIRTNNDSLSMRIKFKILDIIDLREKDRWQSKKKDDNPKKLDELRKAHEEKLEQEKRQNVMNPRRSQNSRGLGQSGGSSGQLSSLGNDYGGNRGTSNMHSSSSSQALRDHQLGDNVVHDTVDHRSKIDNIKGIFLQKNQDSSKTQSQSLRPFSQFRLGPSTATPAASGDASKKNNLSAAAATTTAAKKAS